MGCCVGGMAAAPGRAVAVRVVRVCVCIGPSYGGSVEDWEHRDVHVGPAPQKTRASGGHARHTLHERHPSPGKSEWGHGLRMMQMVGWGWKGLGYFPIVHCFFNAIHAGPA